MQEKHLSRKHAHTVEQIFQHPTTHDLEWRNVVALIKHSGSVQEEANGHLIFLLNGISGVFHRPQDKDVLDIEQVLEIRRFLERAGIEKAGTLAPTDRVATPGSMNEKEQPSHDEGHVNADRNRRTEQQLKTQQHQQNDRSAFLGGDSQAHQQGNRHK